MFTAFPDDFKELKPEKFDYPFYYSPKELALKASIALMEELESNMLKHNFNRIGKMFGVLICEKDNQIGYLKAFSGVLENEEKPSDFVPHLYDELPNLASILSEKESINQLTQKISDLEKIDHTSVINKIDNQIKQQEEKFIRLKESLKEKKKKRKLIRLEQHKKDNFSEVEKELIRESLKDKYELRMYSKKTLENIKELKYKQDSITAPLKNLKELRKKKSKALHNEIYSSYKLLNNRGETKDLIQLFDGSFPPAGSGDCALPKLLQYAFKNNITPLGFAEFWWGAPHKAQIRKHKNFYHACTGKCKPILSHMLEGIELEDNPIISFQTKSLSIETIFEDDDIMIINKPSGLLSVPGTKVSDSVYTRIKDRNPNFTGPIIVHRLDQDTSGLMVLAKNETVYSHLQQQFIKRTIKKRYTALLEGIVDKDYGNINLPLRLDLENRPLQVVCSQHGKEAYTEFQVIKRENGRTLIHFFPHTGRTHQLRMHAAHQDGLACPIVGDDFYGTKDKRLCLQASKLELIHPSFKDLRCFELETEF